MKIPFLLFFVVALLLSLATSEARSRRYRSQDGGGPLSRSRGLSQGESAAVGAVLAAATNLPAEATAPHVPARRLSPDYYRVYSRRMQATATPQRVAAVATPTPKPRPTPAPAPVVVKPPVPKVRKVAVPAPAPKGRVAAKPVPAPAKPTPVTVRRVAAVAPVAKPKPVATPRPTTVKPQRVLMLPPGTTSRTMVLPVKPGAPVEKPRKKDKKTPATTTNATGRPPVRTVFPEPNRR